MSIVFLTALAVGGSTTAGCLIGFLFKRIPHKYNDGILGFASGIMLAASFFGLLIPSLETGGKHALWVTAAGLLSGALFLNLADKFTPHLHNIAGKDSESHAHNADLDKVLLFVMAIAIHNLPEGIAAGVGFGTDDLGNAISVATGIALQNVPESMVISSPLLQAGVSRVRVTIIGVFIGLIEVAGTYIGFYAVTFVSSILPFALSFAGGTMLYIISDEMIPETHSHGFERMATYSLLFGFIVMMIISGLIG